jgi:hypothetical protein
LEAKGEIRQKGPGSLSDSRYVAYRDRGGSWPPNTVAHPECPQEVKASITDISFESSEHKMI